MYCIKCGAEITEDATYCSACGYKVDPSKPAGENNSAPEEHQAKSKKKKASGPLILLLLITLGTLTFGIFNLVDLYDYYLFRTEGIDESVQIYDTHPDISAGEEGADLVGSLQVPGGEIVYDAFFDDDTDQDGYQDRRSYYLEDQLVFASWDDDLDGRHDLFMEMTEGLYVAAEFADVDRDGSIDEVITFDRDGEVTGIEKPETHGTENVNASLRFTDVLEIQDYLLVVVPVLLLLVLIPLLWKSTKGRRVAKRALSILLIASLLGVQLSASTYAFDLYNADGSINQQVFDLEWMKYSDIDDRIPPESRSYPAQQVMQSQEQIAKLHEEMILTIAEKEMLRQEYTTFVAVKKAIAAGHQINLIKSIVRLSVLSYRVGSMAASVPKFVAKFGTKAVDIANQVVENVDPVNLSLMFAVPTAAAGTVLLEEDIKESVSGAVDASVEKVQKTIVTNSYIKLDEAEIEILRQGYLKNRKADDDILQNRKAYREKYERQRFLASETERLMEEQSTYLAQEKERVFALLSERAPAPEEVEVLPPEETDEGEGTFDFLEESPVIDLEIVEEDPNLPTAQEIIVGRWNGTATFVDFQLLNRDQHSQQDIDDFDRINPVGSQVDELWVFAATGTENQFEITFTDGMSDLVEITGNQLLMTQQYQMGDTYVDAGFEGTIDPVDETLEGMTYLEGTVNNQNEGKPDYQLRMVWYTEMKKE